MLSLFSTSARSLSFTRLYQLSTTRPYALLIRLIVPSFATLPSLLLPPSFSISQIDLMEAAEATAMESAILWRVQTILETLAPGELDACLHGVGLAGGIGELKSEVERMETVVNGVKGRAVGNKPLARSLARVKELMYEADDVVDELDYCRLQHKVEERTYASILVVCDFLYSFFPFKL